ncbi:hypothetical protein STEG23_036727, partial [Scotinomys teguina]
MCDQRQQARSYYLEGVSSDLQSWLLMEQSKLHKNVAMLTLEKNRLLEDWVLLKHHLGDLKLLDEDQEETSDLQNQQQQ